MTKYFSIQNALEILNNHHNGIITVVFTKRTDGNTRILNGILNCHKHVKGVGLAFDPKEKHLCTVYDLKVAATLPEKDRSKAYRMINLEKVMEIRANGQIFLP